MRINYTIYEERICDLLIRMNIGLECCLHVIIWFSIGGCGGFYVCMYICSCAILGWCKKLNSESLQRWLIALTLAPKLLNTLLFFRWSIWIFAQQLPMKPAWTDTCAAVKWIQCVPVGCLFFVIQLVSNNTGWTK